MSSGAAKNPVLIKGSSGPAVTLLQRSLNTLGQTLPVDGEFGGRTLAAVQAFQRTPGLGLTADGVVGPATWAAIEKRLGQDAQVPVNRPAKDAFPSDRCYPLRMLPDGRRPVVTSRHKVHNPERPRHYGVDLFYAYKPDKDPPKKIGDSGRTARWWIPEDTYAIAPADGVVTHASWSATGFRVWLEHQNGWRTGYFHMDRIVVQVGQRLTLGTTIGRVNDNPRDTDPDHLHFELYRGDMGAYPGGTRDPEQFLVGCRTLPPVENALLV